MSDEVPVVEKVKNPKRVAAGKALAEKNRKYKEHFEKTAGEVKTETAVTPEPKSGDTSTNYYVFGAIILCAAGFVYYYQSRALAPAPKPEPVSKPAQVFKPKPNRLITI